MKITTKFGDKGGTYLFGNTKISKSCFFIKIIGELDELQSFVGWCRCALLKDDRERDFNKKIRRKLEKIQDNLYIIMGEISENKKSDLKQKNLKIHIKEIEKDIKNSQNLVKDVNKFIRPCENEISSRFHICRTVCRRAERTFVELCEKNKSCFKNSNDSKNFKINEKGKSEILIYLNRLSDWFFINGYYFEG